MEAKEFYIGKYYNQVVYEHEPCNPKPIIWEQSNWYAIGECIEFLEWFEPIALTKEWFTNFGFVKKAGKNGYLWVLNDIEIAEVSVGFFIESGVDNKKSKYLKYVHELQNYCQSNYDEELIIL